MRKKTNKQNIQNKTKQKTAVCARFLVTSPFNGTHRCTLCRRSAVSDWIQQLHKDDDDDDDDDEYAISCPSENNRIYLVLLPIGIHSDQPISRYYYYNDRRKKNNTLSEKTVSYGVCLYYIAARPSIRAVKRRDVVASCYNMLLLLLLCTRVTDDGLWMIQTRLFYEEIIIGNHRLHARA